jgi:hypothetical protein
MVMNKDTRYGMGDFTFNMNVGWFSNMLFEQGGQGFMERDDNDDEEIYKFYTRMEGIIGGYIDGCVSQGGCVGDDDIYYYLMENKQHPLWRWDIEQFYFTEDSDSGPSPRPPKPDNYTQEYMPYK